MAPGLKTVTIFGGTGMIGSQVVREMAAQGFRIKVACRVPERAYDLKLCGNVGQITPVVCSASDPGSIHAAVKGSDFVINCVGILFGGRGGNFKKIHVDLPRTIADACRQENVERFVHISALGVDKGTSHYAASKREGELAVMQSFPATTILRPAPVFGPDDNFINKFARLARLVPFLPLIGGGRTKLQPVFVGDVAAAVMAALLLPAGTPADPRGRIFELGGPEVVDFRDLYRRIAGYTGRRRMMLPLPFGLMKFQAFFMALLPNKILTPDQVESLKTDSVVTPGAADLAELGLMPTAMDSVLPTYLVQYRVGGAFAAMEKENPLR